MEIIRQLARRPIATDKGCFPKESGTLGEHLVSGSTKYFKTVKQHLNLSL